MRWPAYLVRRVYRLLLPRRFELLADDRCALCDREARQSPLHHTVVIGLEALEQMEMAGHLPKIIVGRAGGGRFPGSAAPSKMLREKRNLRAIAAELLLSVVDAGATPTTS